MIKQQVLRCMLLCKLCPLLLLPCFMHIIKTSVYGEHWHVPIYPSTARHALAGGASCQALDRLFTNDSCRQQWARTHVPSLASVSAMLTSSMARAEAQQSGWGNRFQATLQTSTQMHTTQVQDDEVRHALPLASRALLRTHVPIGL